VADLLLLIVRGAVALGCGAVGVVALTHWLIRRGTLSPFGGWARFVRGASGTVVKATEAQLLRRGGNPQDAPYWLLGVAVLGGLILVSVTQTLIGFAYQLDWARQGGVKGILHFLLVATYNLLSFALLVRALGSWFGFGRWTPWMRPFHQATDWMLRPLQRILPPVGMVDFSPLVALLIISLVIRPLVAALFQ
jgi:YggT family protein